MATFDLNDYVERQKHISAKVADNGMFPTNGPLYLKNHEELDDLEVDLANELTMHHMYMDQLYFMSLISEVNNDEVPLEKVMATNLDAGDVEYSLIYRDPRVKTIGTAHTNSTL